MELSAEEIVVARYVGQGLMEWYPVDIIIWDPDPEAGLSVGQARAGPVGVMNCPLWWRASGPLSMLSEILSRARVLLDSAAGCEKPAVSNIKAEPERHSWSVAPVWRRIRISY